jgi:hypothetical protein
MMRKSAMISSTVRDLPTHRREIMDACLREGVFPLAMEHLPARDADAIRVSLEIVDKADLYVCVFAWRYGHVPDGHAISITEMEFDRAVKRGIPILVFLIHQNHQLTIEMVEADREAQARLIALKARASKGRGHREFQSPEGLRGEVIHALSDLLRREDRDDKVAGSQGLHPLNLIPKAPAPYIAHPYSLLQTRQVLGRQAELNLLTDWVTTNRQVPADSRLFAFVAIGGMGKSALTWKWFNDVVPHEMPALAGRMWWSFYESDARYENFVIRALAYVSGASESAVREMASAEREAQLVANLEQRPFLIVLDGLERILLAYARMDAARLPDEDLDEKTANAISDAGDFPKIHHDHYAEKHRLRQCADLRAGRMLRRLAQLRLSRVLVSSRLFPAELQADTGGPLPGCCAKFLTGLPDDDALNLWRAFGVTGTSEQLLPIFRSCGNYPLLIRALAGEVASFRPAPGKFDQWLLQNKGFRPSALRLKNARTHVLRFALRGLGPNEQYVLNTIAAFRMPATWDALRSVLVGVTAMREEASPDPLEPDQGSKSTTASSQDASLIEEESTEIPSGRSSMTAWIPCPNEAALDAVLTDLEDRGLVGWDKAGNRYDLHPIVRIVSWDRTSSRTKNWILGVIHDYFSTRARLERSAVNDVDDLTPAIELYCTLVALGRSDSAFRLFRRQLNDATLYVYAAVRLRAELLELLLPDGRDGEPSLTASDNKARLLRWLANAYHLLGEPGVAMQMLRSGSRRRLDWAYLPSVEDWRYLAYSAYAAGKLRLAEHAMRNAMAAYDSSKADGSLMSGLAWLMYYAAARGLFDTDPSKEAALERVHHDVERLPRKWILVCLLKAQRCLWQGKPADALEALNTAAPLLDAIDRKREPIRAGRLYGMTFLALDDVTKANEHLQQALAGARALNLIEEELPTLIGLAEIHRRRGDRATARSLLAETWPAAERGPYPMWHADALNVLAHLERDEDHRDEAISAATKAYRLAWCDGPPYTYHEGLTQALLHLRELGAEAPVLAPLDATAADSSA